MATNQRQPWAPDWAVTPGEVLVEALAERGMTQAELARRMARPLKTISEIANGKAAITPETAIQLERVLGIRASFWNGLEWRYREALAQQRARRELEDQVTWAAQFPVAAMAKHGLVPRRPSGPDRVADLLSFFKVSSPAGWQQHWGSIAASYRMPRSQTRSSEALAAWLRWGDVMAEGLPASPYDAGKLQDAVPAIRSVTRQAVFGLATERLRDVCAGAGVVVIVVPELPGTQVSGATRWIKDGVALIQLSLRYRSDDQFWYTFFHEVGHLLHDRRREPHVEDRVPLASEPDDSSSEIAADAFARDSLVPPGLYRDFLEAAVFDARSVRAFAATVGVSPGIVVGRLEHDGFVGRGPLDHLRRRYPADN